MDNHVTPAGRTVLDELGLDPAYTVKAKLALRIQRTVAESGWTQIEAAARMPLSQPKLSLLLRGKLDHISQTKLEACLQALGHNIDVVIGPRRDGTGRIEVREAA